MVALIGGTTSLIILIAVIGLIKECVGPKVNPLDNSYMTQRVEFGRAIVRDSTDVGFELVWYTTNPVTNARAEEIKSRRYIREAQKRLLEEAPEHFGHNFINTDIHDFAAYARKYDVDADVRLVNIFVYGEELEKQYLQPNPSLPDGCTEYNPWTQQGILYLEENNIYICNHSAEHVYRYWKCWRTSTKDERYTHFTASEYIQ